MPYTTTPTPNPSRRYTSFGKAITSLSIGVLLFIVIIPGCWVMSPHINNYLSRQEFDAKKWKEGEGDWQTRLHMVHDLTENYPLLGMSRREAIELLGSPGDSSRLSLGYSLGPVGSGIDYAQLQLRLNPDDTIVGYRVSYH